MEEPEEQEAPYAAEAEAPPSAAAAKSPVSESARTHGSFAWRKSYFTPPYGGSFTNEVCCTFTATFSGRWRCAGASSLRSGPIPARPAPPPPRPGQILSGPRQPLPAASPGVPPPMPLPSVTFPAHPVARVGAPPSVTTPGPASVSPGPSRGPVPLQARLCGRSRGRIWPASPRRGLLFPRVPDMVARLQQTRPSPGQAPQAPPPGNADAQFYAGSGPADLSRSHSPRPARDARSRCLGGPAARRGRPDCAAPERCIPRRRSAHEPATLLPTTEQQRRHPGEARRPRPSSRCGAGRGTSADAGRGASS